MRTWRILFVRYVRWRKSKRWSVTRNSLQRQKMADLTLQRFKDLTRRSHSQCPKLFQRYLSFDVASTERNIYKSRSATGEEHTRRGAQFTDSHRAHGNASFLGRDEIDQSRQLLRSVGACRQLENIRAIHLCRARFLSQLLGTRRAAQAVPRNEPPHLLLSSHPKH